MNEKLLMEKLFQSNNSFNTNTFTIWIYDMNNRFWPSARINNYCRKILKPEVKNMHKWNKAKLDDINPGKIANMNKKKHDALKTYEPTEFDWRTWLHVSSGTFDLPTAKFTKCLDYQKVLTTELHIKF